MKLVQSIIQLQELTDAYFSKGANTNNYVLLATYEHWIHERKLFVVQGNRNVCFLVEKPDFFQLYFYINEIQEVLEIKADKPVTMELVYRGEENRPLEMLNYWHKAGFNTHLTRVQMSFTLKNEFEYIAARNSELEISLASTPEEAQYITGLFAADLDKFTGDRLSFDEMFGFVKQGNVLCARFGGELCGALQFENKNKVVWLGHIVVDASYRGKKIAHELVQEYLRINITPPLTRYQLWVIQDNLPAVNLYKRFGFVYAGRSTVSMLKL